MPKLEDVRSEMPHPVLVVDDDLTVASVVCRLLEQQGFEVAVASSFGDASRIGSHFEIGVFDINLGDGCGVDLAEALERDGLVDSVVFMTGFADQDTLGRAAAIGPVVDKGQSPQAIIDRVVALLA